MCYPKPGPRCSNHTRKAYNRALEKHGADSPEAQGALIAWLLTPEGIKHLRSQGLHDLAMDYERERAEQIKEYHESREVVADRGFDYDGYHEETGTRYDAHGFDRFGIHRDTGTEFDEEGYDAEGYDNKGWSRDGIHRTTAREYDAGGWYRSGIHRVTGTEFNEDGYDRQGYDNKGYNSEGWSREGINRETGTKYDRHGFNRWGRHREGFHRNTSLHRYIGLHRDTGEYVDPKGERTPDVMRDPARRRAEDGKG